MSRLLKGKNANISPTILARSEVPPRKEQLVAKRQLFMDLCLEGWVWYQNRYKEKVQPDVEPRVSVNEMGVESIDHSESAFHFRDRVLYFVLTQLHMKGYDEKEKFSLYPWVIYFEEPGKAHYLFEKPQFAPLVEYIKAIILEVWYNKGTEMRNQAESYKPPSSGSPSKAARGEKAEKLQSPSKRSKAIQKAQDSDSPMKKKLRSAADSASTKKPDESLYKGPVNNLFEYEYQTRKLLNNASVKFAEPEVASPEKPTAESSKKSSATKSALKASNKVEAEKQPRKKPVVQPPVESMQLNNEQSCADFDVSSSQEVDDLKKATRESILHEIRERKSLMGMPDVELNIEVLANIVEDVLCMERATDLGTKMTNYAVCMHASFASLYAFENAQKKQAQLLRELHEENKEYARVMIQQLSDAVGKYN